MDISNVFASCGKKLALAISLTGLLITGPLVASPTNETHSIPLVKADESKPATKLEVIASVKKIYSGRILSVRKNYKAYGNDCHNVKLIDKQGELLLIRVGCQ